MPKRRYSKTANRDYHDRVANVYDKVYDRPRWEAYFELSWDGLKPFLPREAKAPVIDLGCGTGLYGLRLAKSGYQVTLSDLSHQMLDVARVHVEEASLTESVSVVQADLMDLGAFPENHFALAVAQGDPICFTKHPPTALKEIRRILRPEGILVASVDQSYAAIDHYARDGDLEGLGTLLRTGEIEWLAHRREERFPVHTFTVESLQTQLDRTGFDVLDLFAKTVLPLQEFEDKLEEPAQRRKLLALEKKLCRKASALGRASHLQVAARKR